MFDQNQLNEIKSKISCIYLEAIATKLGYTIQKADTGLDNLGIDYQIFRKIIGSKKTSFSIKDIILVQLKCTSYSSLSVYKENSTEISYKLDGTIYPVEGSLVYLFIVVVPEHEKYDEWINCTPEFIAIKKCAFYIKVEKELKGTIKIPKSNLLNHKSLKLLFNSVKI